MLVVEKHDRASKVRKDRPVTKEFGGHRTDLRGSAAHLDEVEVFNQALHLGHRDTEDLRDVGQWEPRLYERVEPVNVVS